MSPLSTPPTDQQLHQHERGRRSTEQQRSIEREESGLTHVHHLLQTLGTDSVQAAQKLGFSAASVIAVVADFTLQFFHGVNQRLGPGLYLHTEELLNCYNGFIVSSRPQHQEPHTKTYIYVI